MTTVMEEMLRCLDARLEVLARLDDLRAAYPAMWQMLRRRVQEGRL